MSALPPTPPSAPLTIESITGPHWPLNSAAALIAPHGYSEHEYRVQGQAARYRLDNPAGDARLVDTGHGFATRLLVRRPTEPQRCSGVVVLEWLNVSAGQDIDFIFAASRELLLREGHVWVGASVQRVGVEQLGRWQPQRYAALSVAAPATDPQDGCTLDPADAFTGAAGGDVLCWDIFTQLGQLLRSAQVAALGLVPAHTVVAAGESQSAIRLGRYYNSLQPLSQAFDGFLLYDRGPMTRLRDDVPAKLIGIGTEFFAEYTGVAAPADSSHQRWWELAGAAHVSLDEMVGYVDPQVLRDASQQVEGVAVSLSELLACGATQRRHALWSRVPNGDLVKAALHALLQWQRGGPAPATAPRLLLDAQGKLVRDAQGRVVGGIRYPAYEVPDAENVGVDELGVRLAGYHRNFDADELQALYGSAQHYLANVQAVLQVHLALGTLLPEEAERVHRQAEALADRLAGTPAQSNRPV